MNKVYKIQHTDETDLSIHSKIWEQTNLAEIDQYVWKDYEYEPVTTAKIRYNDKGLTILFQSDESEVLQRYTGINEPVCTDSCVELFINPNPKESADYMNIEVSAAGGILIGKGAARGSRKNLDDFNLGMFQVEKEIGENGWSLKLFVPFSYLEQHYGSISKEMKGNLQKCGDDTIHPHYGSWNPIVAPKPDFHRPECFGDLILE